MMRRRFSGFFLGILLSLSVAGSVVAQTPSPPPGELAPGTATRIGEAPGGSRLDPAGNPMPAPSVPTTENSAQNDPSASRAMAFGASGGECRDSVPGGSLLALAYACILAAMGVYVAILARKNAQLAEAIEELEAQFEKRSASKEKTS